MPKFCVHADAVAEQPCPSCGVLVATCPGCDQLQVVDVEGSLKYHNWPPPTRQLCAGSTYSNKEIVARAG